MPTPESLSLSFVSTLAEVSAPEAIAVFFRPSSSVTGGAAAGSATSGSPALTDVTEVEASFDVSLGDQLRRHKAKGEAGEIVGVTRQLRPGAEPVSDVAGTLFAVGVGDGSARSYRRAGAGLARRVGAKSRLAVLTEPGTGPIELAAFAEGLTLGSYRLPQTRRPTGEDAPAQLEQVSLVGEHSPEQSAALEAGRLRAAATVLARDLANTPAGDKPPARLAEQALASPGVTVRVWDETQLAAEGFGGILAVGAGSPTRPPRMVELSYHPADARGPHVVLVGKGITFDSGGLSLKPRETMPAMKTDMSGAAAVLGIMRALPALGFPVRVTGLMAIAENVPSGSAYRPSDVLTQYGGTTVEVLNTDAEGRLVLADALAYAVKQLAPDVLIDLATLTGAASLGLGKRHAALFTGDDTLADELAAAAEASGERVWRMPLVEEYRASLDSEIADLCHISTDPHVPAGAITAALFLREFVGNTRWAHLDIAGPARSDGDEHEVSKGGTGYGARLLLTWLEGLAASSAVR